MQSKNKQTKKGGASVNPSQKVKLSRLPVNPSQKVKISQFGVNPIPTGRMSQLRVNPNEKNIEQLVDNFIEFVNMYNKNVDEDNANFINLLDSQSTPRKIGGSSSATNAEIGTFSELEKKTKIEQLLTIGNIEEVFKLIKQKTELYWYDYVDLTQSILKKFINFLFKKRISQNQVAPNIEWKYEYFKNKKFKVRESESVFIHRDDANLETLYYLSESPSIRFVFNNHPFSSLKYSCLNNISTCTKSTEYNENGYVWFIKRNTVSIYKSYSTDKLQTIVNSKLATWFQDSDPFKVEKLKIIMNHHPYLFYIDYEQGNEKEKIIEFYPKFKVLIEYDSRPVVIQQGKHGLCWLCSILNAIYFFNKNNDKLHVNTENIKSDYVVLIEEMLNNFSVLEFIKKFKLTNTAKSILDITREGCYTEIAIQRILTINGIKNISSEIVVENKNNTILHTIFVKDKTKTTSYNIIPIIEWKGHCVFCVDSRIYDPRTPYVSQIDWYYDSSQSDDGYNNILNLIHIKSNVLAVTEIIIHKKDDLKKYFAYQSGNELPLLSGGGKSIIKRHLKNLYKCPDGRLRKAFRIQGNGNTIFVTVKNNIVKAKSIPKSKRVV